jgi:hypothetical protein
VLGLGVVGFVSSPLRPYESGAREVFTGRKVLMVVVAGIRTRVLSINDEEAGDRQIRDSGKGGFRRRSEDEDERGRGYRREYISTHQGICDVTIYW